jgi:hypothetical protein
LAIAQQCRNRLQSAETAKRAIMNESGLVQAGNVVTHQQVADRLGVDISQLTCPKTGELYRLGGLADPASCSVGGNGTPTISADNHMIR